LLDLALGNSEAGRKVAPGIGDPVFFVSPGDWPLRQLLTAMAVAGAFQFENQDGKLAVSESPAHRLVVLTEAVRDAMHESLGEVVRALRPFTRRPAFQAMVQPFGESAFEKCQIISGSDLSPAAVKLVTGIMPDDLPIVDVHVICRFRLIVGSRSSAGGGTLETELSETLADFPPPPLGERYAYIVDPGDAFREWRAKVIYPSEGRE
jgi:hypothetical protein